jgi:hypothetical protein
MEAQSDVVITSSASRSQCGSCGAAVPISYPACLKCGAEVASVDRLRYATFRLRMMNEKIETMLADDPYVASMVTAIEIDPVAEVVPARVWPQPEEPSIQPVAEVEPQPLLAALPAPEPAGWPEPEEYTGEDADLDEPVDISEVRAKRGWLRLPFMRKAS